MKLKKLKNRFKGGKIKGITCNVNVNKERIIMNTIVDSKINKELIDELKEECLEFVKLANQLELETLTEDQSEEVLGTTLASLAHLHIHSGLLKEQLNE